jgi:hypothetical protein
MAGLNHQNGAEVASRRIIFMITTSTIGVYTGFMARWLALGGYAVAALLLIGSYYFVLESYGILDLGSGQRQHFSGQKCCDHRAKPLVPLAANPNQRVQPVLG